MHASRILGYAAKHGYSDIVDVATPLVIDWPASETAHDMPQELVILWVRLVS